MCVGAQRALGAIVARRLFKRGIDGEVLVDVHAALGISRFCCSFELGIRCLKARSKAPIFDDVLIAHAVHDDRNGMRGQKEA